MVDDERRLSVGRRSGKDRRSGVDTRTDEERRSIGERRSKKDRRSGSDRRPNYQLREDHLLAFGTIVQDFARFERLIEISVSNILGSKYALTAIVMSNLGYMAKCDALKSLLSITSWPSKDAASKIIGFVDDFNVHLPLRNAIAHLPWMLGTRADSVKPLSARSRGGKIRLLGVGADGIDYSLAELQKIGYSLVLIHDSFGRFLVGIGAATTVAANIDDTSSAV
jgi:hypothetical protein